MDPETKDSESDENLENSASAQAPPGDAKQVQEKEKKQRMASSKEKDSTDTHSHPSPGITGEQKDYMADTAASKSKYRDKVPLTPGIPTGKEIVASPHVVGPIPRQLKSYPVRWVSSHKRDARGDLVAKENSAGLRSLDEVSPSEFISDTGPAHPQGDRINRIRVLEQELAQEQARRHTLEEQLAQATTEKNRLEAKQQTNVEEGMYMSKEEILELSRRTMGIHNENERLQKRTRELEETNRRYLEDIESWKVGYEQIQHQLEEMQAEVQRQQRWEKQSLLSPMKQGTGQVPMAPVNEDLAVAYDDLREDYEDTRAVVRKLRTKNQELYKEVPRLRRENQDLRQQFASSRMHCEMMQESLERTAQESANWEAEYKVTSERLENERVQYEAQLAEQTEEVMKYIRDYHERMPERDKKWWHIEGLQKKVSRMEEQVIEISGRLEVVKEERQTAYREIEILTEKNESLTEENKTLASANKGEMTDEDIHRGDVNSSFNNSSRKLPQASWDTSEARAIREQAMHNFREGQRKSREEAEKAGEIISKVRRWYLGGSYPGSKKSWKKEMSKTAWQRWDGDGWLDRGATRTDVKDKEIIDRLRSGMYKLGVGV